jgi:hypothetical protein
MAIGFREWAKMVEGGTERSDLRKRLQIFILLQLMGGKKLDGKIGPH